MSKKLRRIVELEAERDCLTNRVAELERLLSEKNNSLALFANKKNWEPFRDKTIDPPGQEYTFVMCVNDPNRPWDIAIKAFKKSV